MAYRANLHATTNKPIGIAQAVPTDARSYFYDEAQFSYRAFNSTTEVLTYLDTPSKRAGHFPIILNLAGEIKEYWFRDGPDDAHLIEKTGGAAKDNYQLWLEDGNVGDYDAFFEASRGPAGKDGAAGKDGTNGTNGTNGLNGKDGLNGTNGTNGLNGLDGRDGRDGINGINGIAGKDGDPGPQGPPAYPWHIVAVLEASDPLPLGGHPNFAYGKKDADGNIHTWVYIPAIGQYVDFGTLGNTAGTVVFIPIAENQYGEHPAFNTQRELDIWLITRSTALMELTSGYGLVDDLNNIFYPI